MKQLLAAGADANITDHAGWTPLHEACNHGNVSCLRELLKARRLVCEINPEDGMRHSFLVITAFTLRKTEKWGTVVYTHFPFFFLSGFVRRA